MCKRWRSGADPAWRTWGAWFREGFTLYFAGMLLHPVRLPGLDGADRTDHADHGDGGSEPFPEPVLRDPPSDHPEKLRPDLPLTPLEVGIEQQLGVRPAADPEDHDGESP